MYASRNTNEFWRKPLAIDNGVGEKLIESINVTIEYVNEGSSLISRSKSSFFFRFCASASLTVTSVAMQPTQPGLEESRGQIHN